MEKVIKAGATFVQLREKSISRKEFIVEAQEIRKLTERYNVPFVINDDIDVALASNADGVHVGQSDMNAKDVRGLIGDDKILGVSVQTVEQAINAKENGADYIGVGAVFSTSTKLDADIVTLDTVKKICKSVSIPVVVIGGINKDSILLLKGSGIDGVAVISAMFAQSDFKKATIEMRSLAEEVCRDKNSY